MTGRTIRHYKITGALGEGGMGVVYRAEDTQLGRTVALKSLPLAAVADEARRARFLREARAASSLNHPHIITIHDLIHEGAEAFLVMELIDGKTLEALIHGHGIPLGEALRFAIPIADALAAAHQAGIVHRDLKPGNVMVTQSGVVKVLDFGLAKVPVHGSLGANDATRTASHTEEGAIIGTISYMSPEQAQGKPVDARSDIFSFGALFYEMLTGRKAFTGETKLSTLAAVLEKEPPPISAILPGLPREVDRLLHRCLRKDPAKRWQTMADLKVALEELKEESDSGRLSGTAASPTISAPSRKALYGAIAAAVLLAAAAFVWMHSRQAPVETPMRKVTLTTYPGSEIQPTLSPDGRQIAFAWNGPQADNFDIYVKMIDSGEPLRLTSDPAEERMPRWSPDGKVIAFNRGNGIYAIAPLGGSERKLTEVSEQFGGFNWRPDGKALAIADQNAIYVFTLDDGHKTKVSPPSAAATHRMPAFSPDGQSIAFMQSPALVGQSQLMVIPAAGGVAQRLAIEASFFYTPVWTADGREVIVSIDTGEGLARVPVPDGKAVGKAVVIAAVAEDARDPAISAAPPRLVYSRGTSDSDIWTLTGNKPERLIASTRRDFAAQISPDGRRLAFTSDRTGSWELYVSDAQGGKQTQLTNFNGAIVEATDWSPDGKEILGAVLEKGNRDVFVIGSEGGVPQRLTREPSQEGRPKFSRDGRTVYFRSDRSGREEIWKIPRAGGPATQVTRDGGFDAQESIDGKTLYFTTDRRKPGLWAIPVGSEADEAKKVLDGVQGGWWVVTESGLYYLDSANSAKLQPRALRHWTPGPAATTAVVAMINAAIWNNVPVLSSTRDGKRFFWHQYNPTGADLVMLENFH